MNFLRKLASRSHKREQREDAVEPKHGKKQEQFRVYSIYEFNQTFVPTVTTEIREDDESVRKACIGLLLRARLDQSQVSVIEKTITISFNGLSQLSDYLLHTLHTNAAIRIQRWFRNVSKRKHLKNELQDIRNPENAVYLKELNYLESYIISLSESYKLLFFAPRSNPSPLHEATFMKLLNSPDTFTVCEKYLKIEDKNVNIAKEETERELHVLNWMYGLLNLKPKNQTLHSLLRSGALLISLLTTLHPIPCLLLSRHSNYAIHKIVFFLECMKGLGIKRKLLFSVSDILLPCGEGSRERIISSLLALERFSRRDASARLSTGPMVTSPSGLAAGLTGGPNGAAAEMTIQTETGRERFMSVVSLGDELSNHTFERMEPVIDERLELDSIEAVPPESPQLRLEVPMSQPLENRAAMIKKLIEDERTYINNLTKVASHLSSLLSDQASLAMRQASTISSTEISGAAPSENVYKFKADIEAKESWRLVGVLKSMIDIHSALLDSLENSYSATTKSFTVGSAFSTFASSLQTTYSTYAVVALKGIKKDVLILQSDDLHRSEEVNQVINRFISSSANLEIAIHSTGRFVNGEVSANDTPVENFGDLSATDWERYLKRPLYRLSTYPSILSAIAGNKDESVLDDNKMAMICGIRIGCVSEAIGDHLEAAQSKLQK